MGCCVVGVVLVTLVCVNSGGSRRRRSDMLGNKYFSVIVPGLVFVLMMGVVGCAPSASDGGCDAVKADLDRAKAELVEVKAASLEELLRERRSVRDYADAPLTQDEVLKLLWAGQGITRVWGGRTAPSAGALYPLEIYLVAGDVENLSPGVYKYKPTQNTLSIVKDGDVRASLAATALGQNCVKKGAIDIVIAAVYERTTRKYGSRGQRYVHIEVGHAAQNICLQATALGLGLAAVGAFDDARVKNILGMSQDEMPLYVMPVGRRM
jgi:SagB-type dehydrogenase family enzyme